MNQFSRITPSNVLSCFIVRARADETYSLGANLKCNRTEILALYKCDFLLAVSKRVCRCDMSSSKGFCGENNTLPNVVANAANKSVHLLHTNDANRLL